MVKSVTVPGKCYAISAGDRQDDPTNNNTRRVYYNTYHEVEVTFNPFESRGITV